MSETRDIVERFPEINPSNYNHDDVVELNLWGIEAADLITRLRTENATLKAECGAWKNEAQSARKWVAESLKANKGGATDDLGDPEAVAWDAYMNVRRETDRITKEPTRD